MYWRIIDDIGDASWSNSGLWNLRVCHNRRGRLRSWSRGVPIIARLWLTHVPHMLGKCNQGVHQFARFLGGKCTDLRNPSEEIVNLVEHPSARGKAVILLEMAMTSFYKGPHISKESPKEVQWTCQLLTKLYNCSRQLVAIVQVHHGLFKTIELIHDGVVLVTKVIAFCRRSCEVRRQSNEGSRLVARHNGLEEGTVLAEGLVYIRKSYQSLIDKRWQ